MNNLPIPLSTKYNRPPVPEDFISKPALFETLHQGLSKPLTLITAPAGYGKTTLASAWFEEIGHTKSWISLDRNDNDLGSFLAYFLSAIWAMFPDAGKQTRLSIAEANLLNPLDISYVLINDLDQISQDFVIVLDNYSAIQEQTIHDLLAELLRHPPHAMHLLLTSRHDPPLPVNSLRAGNQMVEIREQSLRFTPREIEAFFDGVAGVHLNEKSVAILDKKTEGWAAGLRLVALSMINSNDFDQSLAGIEKHNRYIIDYLASEVLFHLPANIEAFLLKTSILENLNSSLCEAVTGLCDPFENGQTYLGWLDDASLFTMVLDTEKRWFRYHQLFQEVLNYFLRQRCSANEIGDLNIRASKWYAANGYIDEAIKHAKNAGDLEAIVHLIEENRHKVMNREGWQQLEHWLQAVPREMIDEHPDLLLIETWLMCNHSQNGAVTKNLDQIEALIESGSYPSNEIERVRGEVSALRSQQFYWQANSRLSLYFARRSLEDTPVEEAAVRTAAWGSVARALHMQGDLNGAFEALYEGLNESKYQTNTFPAYIFVALSIIHWMEADPSALIQTAEFLLKQAREENLPESIIWANYFLGYAHYEMNDLEAAEKHFSSVVGSDDIANTFPYYQSVFGLAATYQAQESTDRALAVIESAKVLALEMNDTLMLTEIQAFKTRLIQQQGNVFEERRWASQRSHTVRLEPLPTFYHTPVILVQTLLDQGSFECLHEASQMIDCLEDSAKSIHNTRCLIMALSLRALLQDACHNEAGALATLEEAVVLAQNWWGCPCVCGHGEGDGQFT